MNGEGSSENTLEFGEKHFRNDKRIKEMAIDRFGELPDSVVIQILSFLNVKEAAITSVLSKRWEFLWAELPSLVFRSRDFEKLLNFVNRTVAIRRLRVNYLEEFCVSFIYNKCFNSDVNSWVQFAVENKVKKLNLHLDICDCYYIPPQAIYCCPSLTTLNVKGCIMYLILKGTIEWQSLTHLHLHDSEVSERLLDEILSSCPVLYKIYLEDCFGFNRLEVNSTSLRSLSLVHSDSKYYSTALKISAPYIHSLYISLHREGRELQLGNISSLVRADFDYKGLSWNSLSVEVMSGAKQLLENVQHAKELYVGLQFMEVVSEMVLNGWQLPQSRRELLVVAFASEYEHTISGIMGLLESSPNLETLVIQGCAKEGFDVILEPDSTEDLAGDLLHLKTIKFRNFAASVGEKILKLARILLKRATVLEEMVIMTDVKDLSDYRNSSTNAYLSEILNKSSSSSC